MAAPVSQARQHKQWRHGHALARSVGRSRTPNLMQSLLMPSVVSCERDGEANQNTPEGSARDSPALNALARSPELWSRSACESPLREWRERATHVDHCAEGDGNDLSSHDGPLLMRFVHELGTVRTRATVPQTRARQTVRRRGPPVCPSAG